MTGLNLIAPSASGILTDKAEQVGQAAAGVESPQEVAAKFESIFVSLLLKEMRQSIGEGGLFGGGDSSDVFGGLFDLYLGEHVAKSSNLGVGDMIQRYLRASQDPSAGTR